MVNIAIAEKVLRSVLSQPGEHDQENWIHTPEKNLIPGTDQLITLDTMQQDSPCGTTACIAGWAALHDGCEVIIHPRSAVTRSNQTIVTGINYDLRKQGKVIDRGHGSVDLEALGQRALDLDNDEAYDLFFLMNNTEAVAALYSLITTGDVTRLTDCAEAEGVDDPTQHVYDQAMAQYGPVNAELVPV